MADLTGSDWNDEYQKSLQSTTQTINPLAPAQQATAGTGESSYDKMWGASDTGNRGSGEPTSSTQTTDVTSRAADVVNQTGVAPVSTAGPAGTAPGPTDAGAQPYTSAVQGIQTAQNPQDYLVKQDQLARRVASDLTAAGHKVEWNGTQLMVDGRPYEIGGQQWAQGATTTGQPPLAGALNAGYSPPAGATMNEWGYWTMPNGDLASGQLTPGALGFTPVDATGQSWLGPTSTTSPTANPAGAAGGGAGATRPSGGNLRDPTYAQQLVAYWATQPGANPSLTRDPNYWIQKITSGELGADENWIISRFMTPEGAPVGAGGAGGGGSTTGATPTSPQLANYLSTPSTFTNPTQAAPNYDSMWAPSSGDYYTPGAIGNEDMPSFTYESLLRDQTTGNPVEANTDALINKLLQNPESLDPHTLDMLKARDAEEQQQSALQSDEALKRFGLQAGIADSPWLASERASAARASDASIIGNRRNLDIEAARTNKEDVRQAATIGAGYQGQRANQRLQAVNTAVSGALQKAAETRNRFQLNENLKLEAGKLKMSKDELIQQFAIGKMNDITKRYGIDVGASIDLQKLGEQSDQFKHDLLFKLQSLSENARQFNERLGQDDRQFGSDLAYRYDALNSNNLNNYWRDAQM